MYIPAPYKNTNQEEVRRFVQENGFGTLILSNTRQVPEIEDGQDEQGKWKMDVLNRSNATLARHLPFIVDLDSDHYHDGQSFKTLTAHVGKHYPIYDCFNEGDEALIIFQGPQSYISPTWYDNVEGATWNYISVHVRGSIHRFEDEEGDKVLEQLIRALLYKYEKQYKTDPRLTLEIVGERYHYLKQYIRPIRIAINHVEAAYKLSQDQNDWSRQNTITHLRETGMPNAVATADEMEKRNYNVQRGIV